MRLLKDLDWEQQCICKLEYFLNEIKYLEQKSNFDIYDQIRINTLLNILKSPMEYATLTLTKYVSKKQRAFLPFRKDYFNDKDFRNHIKEKIGYVDDDIFTIYNNLFKNDLYKVFNDMQNYEKHSHINVHNQYVTENTGTIEYPGGIIIKDNVIVRKLGTDQKGLVYNNEESDLSQNKGYSYEEELYFEYNNREVFSFLDDVYHMVYKFIADIKEYIEKRSDEHGRY